MDEEHISGVVPIRNFGKSQAGTDDGRAAQIDVVDSSCISEVVIEVINIRGTWHVNVGSHFTNHGNEQ